MKRILITFFAVLMVTVVSDGADPIVEHFFREIRAEELQDLSRIRVGSSIMPQAEKKIQSLPEISAWILHQLQSCPTPCEVQMGKNLFKVQTPALGQGERGVVFRVLDQSGPLVIKISKPEFKSFAILRAESSSHTFWKMRQTANFNVPDRIVTHPSGLFSVMQEIRGEPLTTALFRMGLLQLDPVSGDVIVNSSTKHVPSSELQKIWGAIADLIRSVQENPKMKTSLSPNNIFIGWKDGGRINQISLIDFGIDGTGDSRYFEVKDFSEYLKLSAIKINGYLAKPGYVSADLYLLQEEARKRYGLVSLFDVRAYRPLLEEVAQKLVPPGTTVRDMTLAEILALPVPAKMSARVQVDNVSFTPPRTVADLTQAAIAINHVIAQQSGGVVVIHLNGEPYKIKLPPLGQGDRGVVYALANTDDVIKIPKGNLASVLTLMNEAVGYNFWFNQARQSQGVFSVPERRSIHPLGLFSVMKRDHGESLTKMMVRFGLLTFDPVTGKAKAHPDRIAKMGSANKLKVEKGILGILETIRHNPDYSLSVSPNNLHVNYADQAKTIISDVVLIDVGLGNRNSSKFDAIHDMASYLELSQNRLEKYLKVGYVDEELKSLNRGAVGRCSKVFAL